MKLPWVMSQRWVHLLYMHYPVDVNQLRTLVPPELEIDTFEGTAWVSLIPMHMERCHLRGLIAIPGTANFPELNLRTYVRRGEHSGVLFLSLDAQSPFAVAVARMAFRLPYFEASMTFDEVDGGYTLTSSRSDDPEVRIDTHYVPRGEPKIGEPGTFDAFLAERYCMFSTRRGRLIRGDISHAPWPVQPVDVEVRENTVLQAAGIDPIGEPRFAYSPGTHAVAWPMVKA